MAMTKKPVAKKAPQKSSRAGSRYACADCGMVVILEEDCSCPTIDLVCCGTPMKKKRAVAKK
ncbi:MAG: hypothetical protein HY787_02195 [Deltaproteobacteria bacterium]|nr:hypothetical protein [Deltaproteobacteria bacterium]